MDANVLVWVGDVGTTDGFAAANHLQATSHPYLGVVAPVDSRLMTIGKLEGSFTEDQVTRARPRPPVTYAMSFSLGSHPPPTHPPPTAYGGYR